MPGKNDRATQEIFGGVALAILFAVLDCPSLLFWFFLCIVFNGIEQSYLDARDKKYERDIIDTKLEQQYWQQRYQHFFEEE